MSYNIQAHHFYLDFASIFMIKSTDIKTHVYQGNAPPHSEHHFHMNQRGNDIVWQTFYISLSYHCFHSGLNVFMA